jgi:ABC-type transporter Mla subunit MlaD
MVKSVAFVVVTVVATAMLALSITRAGGGDTVSYQARFTDASGLREGDSVRIAGVEVGRVAGIKVVEHRVALVSFGVGRGHHLPASSTATIKYLNLIGQVVDNLNAVLDTINGRGDNLGTLIGTLRRLVSGLAADRTAIGEAISALDDLAGTTTGLLKDGRAPLKRDIEQLGRLSRNLSDDSPKVDAFLRLLPVKMAAIGRIASYGSWLNLYLCEADLSGVTYKQYPGEQHPPPTGIPLTAERCGG